MFLKLTGLPKSTSTAMVLYSDNAESVEWFNMCWRKASIPIEIKAQGLQASHGCMVICLVFMFQVSCSDKVLVAEEYRHLSCLPALQVSDCSYIL